MNINRIRRFIMAAAMIIMLANLVLLNYQDLSWEANAINYMGIAAMWLVVFFMYFTMKQEEKQDK